MYSGENLCYNKAVLNWQDRIGFQYFMNCQEQIAQKSVEMQAAGIVDRILYNFVHTITN